jgi:hypothetical protein
MEHVNHKLSPAQKRMIDAVKRDGYSECPFAGDRTAGRKASAWWRTADSLCRLGILKRHHRETSAPIHVRLLTPARVVMAESAGAA